MGQTIIKYNKNYQCEFGDYIINFMAKSISFRGTYYDISFKHKNIKGYTNLNEQFIVMGKLCNIVKKFMKIKKYHNLMFTTDDRRLKDFIMCYYNYQFKDNFKLFNDGNNVYLERIFI